MIILSCNDHNKFGSVLFRLCKVVDAVAAQLHIQALPAQAEHLRCQCPVAVSQLQRGVVQNLPFLGYTRRTETAGL